MSGPDPVPACEQPLTDGPCGRRAVAHDVKTHRDVCRAHAPFFPKRMGPRPGLKRWSPCCMSELEPVYSYPTRQERVLRWERCRNCGTTWDAGHAMTAAGLERPEGSV